MTFVLALDGKLIGYFLFFFIAGWLAGERRFQPSLRAALYRFFFGLLTILPVIAFLTIHDLESSGTFRPREFIFSSIFWMLRGFSWWLAWRLSFRPVKLSKFGLSVLIFAGVLFNLGFDLLFCNFPGTERGWFIPILKAADLMHV